MTNRLLFPAILCLVFITTGCKKHAKNVTCTSAPIDVWGVGFPLPDTLAEVIKYKQDNAFDSVIDSIRVTNFSFDTVFFPTLQNLVLTGGYDYKIVLPATKTTFSLTKIRFGSHFSEEINSGTGNSCYNPVVSYTLNDSAIVVADTTRTHSPYRLYLYK